MEEGAISQEMWGPLDAGKGKGISSPAVASRKEWQPADALTLVKLLIYRQ